MALIAWLVICFSVGVTVKYYVPLSRKVPPKLPICLAIIFVRVVYNIAVAWNYNIGTLNPESSPVYMYVLGYLPVLLCLLTMVTYAYFEPNDDLHMIKLRKARDRAADIELEEHRRERRLQLERERAELAQAAKGEPKTSTITTAVTAASDGSGSEGHELSSPPPAYQK